ncbi:MAG: tetratricopeptide repeat protein [bacterium]|nr:tetratricopeptide repeat protein [bacterium]
MTEDENGLQGLKGKTRLKRLAQLVREYRSDNSAKALTFGKEALKMLQRFPDKAIKAPVLRNMGRALYKSENYVDALKFYSKALRLFEELKDREYIGKVQVTIGRIYYKYGDYYKALEHYLASIKYVGSYDAVPGLNRIGGVYRKLGNYEKALEYYKLYLEAVKRENYPEGEAIGLNNMGIACARLERYDKALGYYKKALSMFVQLNDREGVGCVLNNMGIALENTKNLPSAERHYLRALDIARNMKDKYGESAALINLGSFKRLTNNIPEAKAYADKALALAVELKMKDLEMECWEELAFIHTAEGNHEVADQCYSKFEKLRDETFNEGVGGKIAEMLSRYNAASLEKEIEILKRDKAIKQLQLNKKDIIKRFMLAGLVLLCGFIVLLVNRYRLKNRTTIEMRQKNRELTKANEKLVKAYDEIKTLSGLVPICSCCKCIRDDTGFWHQVEDYIEKHSLAEFSHSLCPKCVKEFYPGIHKDLANDS